MTYLGIAFATPMFYMPLNEAKWVSSYYATSARLVQDVYGIAHVSFTYRNTTVDFNAEKLNGFCEPFLLEAKIGFEANKPDTMLLYLPFSSYFPDGCPQTEEEWPKDDSYYDVGDDAYLVFAITATGKVSVATNGYFKVGDKYCQVEVYPVRKQTCADKDEVSAYLAKEPRHLTLVMTSGKDETQDAPSERNIPPMPKNHSENIRAKIRPQKPDKPRKRQTQGR